MVGRFKQYIENHNLIGKDERVLVALSGGVDSMVLAELMRRSGFDIAFAHCNFHLRGEESDGDERFVRNYAERVGKELFVKHFDTIQYAENHKISVEMAARELRYSWFDELLKNQGFHKLAIAHHADDQIETFFINLLRGSGIKGLKAMQPANGLYVRPLLWASREEIKCFAVENDIQWREDRTNHETVYFRNKIRHELLPVLDGIKSDAREKIHLSVDYLASENQLYRKLIEEKLSHIEHVDGALHSIKKDELKDNLQLLFEWVRGFGFSFSQCETIMSVVNSESGKEFYSVDYQLVVENDSIDVFPINLHDENPKLVHDIFVKTPDFKIEKSNPNIAQLDADKIKFPLRLRHWRQGDRFRPLGMHGSKLVSDFFNDLNFSAFQKKTAYILTDTDDRIIWIVGHRIDDDFKITNKTTRICEIFLQ
ncbi:MAG: tRNA lysidine(34) synthetase TilS [Bacteroidia bacterium]|nr:tRNA lysidine(34) synthetase TilS [Bacteroidia bacterium]